MRTETQPQQSLILVTLFNLDDPAERFMLKVLCRYHTETPGLSTMTEIRRIDRKVDGQRRRVILTATRFQPQRRGAKPQWDLVTWDVDEVSVCFHRQPSREAALAEMRKATAASLPH